VVTARVWCGGESEARGGSKAIRREPGEADEQQIEEAGMPEKAEKEARRELDRLSKLPTAAAEYGVNDLKLNPLGHGPVLRRRGLLFRFPFCAII
jgi:hypothetical protein